MEDFELVLQKMRDVRAAHKANLTGVALMKWNLEEKLRGWIMRETGYRCVTVGEIVDKVQKYAPKTILKSREAFVGVVNGLWRAVHDYSINSEAELCEELEDESSNVLEFM